MLKSLQDTLKKVMSGNYKHAFALTSQTAQALEQRRQQSEDVWQHLNHMYDSAFDNKVVPDST